ncbi:MAG: class I SAM-dependent methyltransferase [Chloroflexota bacterium]
MTIIDVLCLLSGLIFCISVVWTRWRGAPWLPASMRSVHNMLTLAEVRPGDVVYDLGCGDGRVIITAARTYGARAVGIELDPLRYAWCVAVVKFLRLDEQVTVIRGDFFTADIADADVVICYLLQSTNEQLLEKLTTELKPGTRLIAEWSTFEGLEEVGKKGRAHLYRIPPSD